MQLLTGSICLSDIPREVMRKAMCRDGKERVYLNIAVIEKKEPKTFTNNGVSRTFTHFVSCAPKREERIEGVNYILGDLESRETASNQATGATVAPAPSPAPSNQGIADSDLPF